jgi:hypothetical protein
MEDGAVYDTGTSAPHAASRVFVVYYIGDPITCAPVAGMATAPIVVYIHGGGYDGGGRLVNAIIPDGCDDGALDQAGCKFAANGNVVYSIDYTLVTPRDLRDLRNLTDAYHVTSATYAFSPNDWIYIDSNAPRPWIFGGYQVSAVDASNVAKLSDPIVTTSTTTPLTKATRFVRAGTPAPGVFQDAKCFIAFLGHTMSTQTWTAVPYGGTSRIRMYVPGDRTKVNLFGHSAGGNIIGITAFSPDNQFPWTCNFNTVGGDSIADPSDFHKVTINTLGMLSPAFNDLLNGFDNPGGKYIDAEGYWTPSYATPHSSQYVMANLINCIKGQSFGNCPTNLRIYSSAKYVTNFVSTNPPAPTIPTLILSSHDDPGVPFQTQWSNMGVPPPSVQGAPGTGIRAGRQVASGRGYSQIILFGNYFTDSSLYCTENKTNDPAVPFQCYHHELDFWYANPTSYNAGTGLHGCAGIGGHAVNNALPSPYPCGTAGRVYFELNTFFKNNGSVVDYGL